MRRKNLKDLHNGSHCLKIPRQTLIFPCEVKANHEGPGDGQIRKLWIMVIQGTSP